MILAFDTTENAGSVALGFPDGRVFEYVFDSVRGHGPTLYAEAERLLADHNLTLRDIQVFAAAAGPGSFTGVRVGLAAAKALAFALGVVATAESSLRILAESAPQAEWVCPVLDARKGEVYAALYRRVAGETVEVIPAWVGPAAAVGGRVSVAERPVFIGSGVVVYGPAFEGAVALPGRVGARHLARLVQASVARAGGGSLAPARAHYVRPAEAEVKFGAAPVVDPLASIIEG